MAKHWIRDLGLARGETTYMGYMPEMWMSVYHLLRCAGWQWVWECDGTNGLLNAPDAGHVPDGNMEAADASAFTAVGATIIKTTSEVKEGYQSLQITGQSGDTVKTSALTVRVPNGGVYSISDTLTPTITFRKDYTQNIDDFYETLVGRVITITGAEPENNGSHVITSITDQDYLTYSDADGVDQAAVGNWRIDVPIHIAMWVKNPGTDTWNVDVDRGDGADFNVGSFAQTDSGGNGGGGWELLHFDFVSQGTGDITITFKPQGASDTTIYVDSIMCFRSFFEFTNDFVDYSGGDTGAYIAQTAPDEFESSNYTFVAGDVGKLLIIFDASGNHTKNTGVYTITSVSAGKAVIDLRSPSFQLESQDGSSDDINWRLVDIYRWTKSYANSPQNNLCCVFTYCGFCLESPYNGWRFLMRAFWDDYQDNGVYFWAAPTAVDFDKLEGTFYPNGISTHSGLYGHTTIKKSNWSLISEAKEALTKLNYMTGRAGDVDYTTRVMMMFEDSGKYFFIGTNPGNITCTALLVGYVADDAYHPGSESFTLLSPGNGNGFSGGTTRDFINWYYTSPSWNYWGVGFGGDGYPRRVSVVLDGVNVTTTVKRFGMTNAQANPFSGEEFLRPLILVRDLDGIQGSPSERELLSEGLYLGRLNMADMTAFGSDTGSGDGVDDKLEISGTTVTLTDNDGTPFTSAMINHPITISGAANGGNNGTFTITAVPTANTLTFENASGVTEDPWSGSWSINMCRYLHIHGGLVMDWPEEVVV